ncbi:MAG: AraC family transcriptional regulator [Desulfobacteraceae bacterium]|nr:AraC family transcriptional regulator [Desulfobacteraceae bacterium]
MNNDYPNEEYISRINNVIDHIQTNLSGHLELATLADVANFSKYHFHRIFRAIMDEPLNRYIQRLRIEKAASQLIHNKKKTITEIAFDCGFSGSSSFARIFKETYKMSATQWRLKEFNNSKIGQTKSKNRKPVSNSCKAIDVSTMYIDPVSNNLTWRIKMDNQDQIIAKVKEMPEMTVAYVRHVGDYKGNQELFGKLIGKLMKWAGPRGLLQEKNVQILSVYYDDPEITNDDKLKLDVCLTIPKDFEVDGEIGKMTISGGKYVVAHFELNTEEFSDAWNMLYKDWLPKSGFQPDDKPCYELCCNDPKEHPEGKHIVDICIPVVPM